LRSVSAAVVLAAGAIPADALPPGIGTESERSDPAPVGPTPPSGGPLWTRPALTGDWGGWRDALAAHGVSFGFTYTGDVWGVVAGGRRHRADYVSDLDLTLSVATEPLLGWRGGKLFVYGIGLSRTRSPSASAGDVQALDNIDAPSQWRLYEAWYQQELLDSRLSVLAGLYDVSGEFDFTETAQLFLNGSFGTGKDFGQSGVHGPSIFPATSLGVRLGARPLPDTYARVAVLDGVPGDLDSDRDPAIFSMSRKQGLLYVGELGYLTGEGEGDRPYAKIGLGAWYYTAHFDRIGSFDANGEPTRRTGSYGMYLLGERTVYREPGAPGQGLALFGRVGFADPRVNHVGVYVGGGAVYTGLLPGRPEDQLGLGVATALAGRRFERELAQSGVAVGRAEVALELTYRAQVAPWLRIQPDLQYVIQPGFDRRVPNALALATRFEITF
jgi:porin